MRIINRICYAVSVICIILGTTLSILTIWGAIDDKVFFGKFILTLGVLFFGSVLTITVNNLYYRANGK